ncbi:MAG: GNAT family N-acetyltransferase [Proteobacteria bacterium]|nr:GNAT family N-acetyltransferase [Pseudomonadota bacterium]
MDETSEALRSYLERIECTKPLDASLETLKKFHAAHVFAIPFENLDIHLHVPIVLEEQHLFDKLITRKRGGYCYELNGLFYYLLQSLGFKTHLCRARLIDEDGELLPDSSHMINLVTLDQRWIADVGWGNGLIYPLCLDTEAEQIQYGQAYKCSKNAEGFDVWQKREHGKWEKLHSLTLHKQEMADFQGRNLYHQTTPSSPFAKERICTKPMEEGYLILKGNRFSYDTPQGQNIEILERDEDYRQILKDRFGLVLEINLPVFLIEEGYSLRSPKHKKEWENYHRIRKEQIHMMYCPDKLYDVEDKEEKKNNTFPLVFVDKDGETILGTVRVDIINNEEASLRWVAIDAPYVGQGLGKKMLTLVEEFLKRRHIGLLRVPAESDSKGFYTHLGYKEVAWPDKPMNAGTLSLAKVI